MTDDAARAEEALDEAIARALYHPEMWAAFDDWERYMALTVAARVREAARQVEILVRCETCRGTGRAPGSRSHPCPDCTDGTVSRSALAVLAGDEK